MKSSIDIQPCGIKQGFCRWKKTLISAAAICALILLWVFGAAIWHVPDPEKIGVLKSRGASSTPLLFARDNRHLVVGTKMMASTSRSQQYFEGELSVWDWVEKKEIHSIRMPQWIQSLSLTSKGDLLAVTIGGANDERDRENDGGPHEVRLYSFPDMKEVGKITCQSFITSTALSADGKFLATATASDFAKNFKSEVCVWDIATRKPKFSARDSEYRNVQIAFSPDGKTLAALDFFSPRKSGPFEIPGLYIRQYQSNSGDPEKTLWLKRDTSLPIFFDFFPDGKRILIDCEWVAIMDRQTGQELELSKEVFPLNRFRSLSLSQDGKWLVAWVEKSAGNRGQQPQIVVFDLDANRIHKEWKATPGTGGAIISPDKKTIALGGEGVHLFSLVPTGKR